MSSANVVITGAGNGMGKAAAIRLAEAGANICLVDLNKETGQQLAEELSKKHTGQKFIFKVVDVTDATAVEECVDAAAKDFGSVTGLICSAGIALPSLRLHEVNLKHFHKTMDVNFNGTMHFNMVVLRHFMKQNESGVTPPKGGYTIVNIGSKGSVEGLPASGAYTASKHGVLGLTRVAAKEYAADNIRINCLCPGLIWSDMLKQLNESGKPELNKDYLLRQCYSRRYGTVEEMANIMNFLMSDQSAYITGQAIEADGMWAI